MPSLLLRLKARPAYLILLAAGFHLTFTTLVFLTGRLAVWSEMFDPTGIGPLFASDCRVYREQAVSLIDILSRDGVAAWLNASYFLDTSLHVKLYSLSFAVLGPWLGYNILAAEPLNVLYYLSILYLVFAIGSEVFDKRTGMLAAGVVAIWPSFLLHTTQLLRDPLFIAALLAFVLACVRMLKRDHNWLQGVGRAFLGGVFICLLWLLRSDMWEVVFAIILVATALLVVEQVRQRRVLIGNNLCAVLLIVMTAFAPAISGAFESYKNQSPLTSAHATNRAQLLAEATSAGEQPASAKWQHVPPGPNLPTRIGYLRHRYQTFYPHAGSNIDKDIEFASTADIVRYLPRAITIGLFAPFPNMWFAEGRQVGLKGRLLSGAETALIYVLQVLAAFTLWSRSKLIEAWFLLLVTAIGLTALSLVVANIAALYRLRYAFWILIIILGANGALQIFKSVTDNADA